VTRVDKLLTEISTGPNDLIIDTFGLEKATQEIGGSNETFRIHDLPEGDQLGFQRSAVPVAQQVRVRGLVVGGT